MRWRLFKIVLTLFSFCNAFAFSQTEDEMKVDADKYFTNGNYLEATSLYMRLLSLNPDDYNLNYRYGACLLFNSNKKQEAVKYLSYSIKNPNATPENHYFLGKSLQYSYRFGEAIKELNVYLQNRPKSDIDFPVERDIEMCQNGKRLLTSVTDLIVLDKKEITTDKFFRIYDLKDIGGSLIVTTDFQTKLDKKNNHTPLIHFPQNPSIVFYSSYGENGEQGKDIYFRKKLTDGTWSDATLIEGKVNTQYDEDFPYLDPSGEYLYFSSKGHNSMGGYDVFRSKFDENLGVFGAPENLDFAISSPDDDVLFIVDSLNQNAYFASARQSELGKLHVYKVMMDRIPLQTVVLKGSFVSQKNPTTKVINIEVSDESGNKIIGNFQSDESGNYTITLPKGGNYEYIMRLDGISQEFRSIVKIPIADGFKPYKQVIKHLDDNNLEVVKVINLFDEVVEDQQELLAEIIRKRSALDVNVSEFDLNKIASLKADRAVLNEIGLSNLSLNEVIDVLEQQTLKNEQNNTLAASISNNVNNLVVENKTEFVRLEEAIKDKVATANEFKNPDDKYKTLKEAENLIKVQSELKKYSDDLLRISDSVNNVLSNGLSQEEQNKLSEISQNYKSLYNDGKEQDALDVLSSNKELIQKSLTNTSGNIVQNLVDKSVQLDESNALSLSKIEKYKEEISALKIQITQLESSQQDAKKKDLPAIENQLASKRAEITLIEDEIVVLQKTIDVKTLEKYVIDKQIDLLQDAISNKSLVTVTRNAADKAITETEKTNSNTLKAYVDQQVKKLETDDPTLKERIIVTSGLNADELYKQYLANNQGIIDDPNLNKETKLFKQLTSVRTTIKQLDDRLAEIEKMIAQGKGNEVLENEKTALNLFKEKIQTEQNERETAVAKILAKEGVGDKETVISSLKTDYLQNKNFIENNSNFSTSEKNKELDKEDLALLSSVEAELKKVDAALINAPNDQVLLIKQNSLNEIKSKLEKDIESRKVVGDVNTDVIADKESIVRSIDKDYTNKVQTINGKDLSEKEKNTALNDADAALIQNLEREVNNIDKQLNSDPSNALLQDRKNQLNDIKSEKEAAIQQRNENNLAATKAGINQESLIKKLSPTYAETIKTINANTKLSTSEKNKELNASDQELIDKTEARLKIIDLALTETPTDELLNQEKTILNELKAGKEKAIENRNEATELETEKIIAALPNYNLDKDKVKLIQQVSPEFFEKLDAVQSSNSASASETAKQRIDIDAVLLEDLKVAKSNLNKQLQNNPGSSDLNNKLKAIETLEGDALDRLMANNKIIESKEMLIEPSTEEISEKRSLLLKDTDSRIQILKSDTSLTEIEKQEAIVEEKNNALNLINQEIVRLSENKNVEPQDPSLQKELAITNLLITDLQSELSAEQKTLASLKKNEVSKTGQDTSEINGGINNNKEVLQLTEASIMQDLMPQYEIEKNRILDDTKLTKKDKNEALLNLENTFNEKIKDEKLVLLERLDSNPSDADAIKRLELLESLEEYSDDELLRLKSFDSLGSSSDIAIENVSSIVNSVAPDYNKNKEALTISKMEEAKKLDQLIKLEERLLNDLNTARSEVETQLKKNPNDPKLLNDKESIDEAIKVHQIEIENYSESLGDLNRINEKELIVQDLDKTYITDIEKLNKDYSSTNLIEIKNREEVLQGRLVEKLNENNAILAAKSDKNLIRENELINELIAESKVRVANLDLSISEYGYKIEFIQEIRMNALMDIEIPSGFDSKTKDELTSLSKDLQDYQDELLELENQKKLSLEKNQQDKNLTAELQWIKEERDLVAAQQQEVKIKIENLQNVSPSKVEDLQYQDQELAALKGRETQIQNQLATVELNKNDEKLLIQELDQIQDQKNNRINEILINEVDMLSLANEKLKIELQNSNGSVSNDEMKVVANYEQSGQEFINLASKTKSIEEKNNLLMQAQTKQLQANDLLLNALTDSKIKEVESGLAASIFNLDEKKNQLEILEMQSQNVRIEIGNLEQEKSTAGKGDIEALNNQIINKQFEQKVLYEKITLLEEEIQQMKLQESLQTIEDRSKNVNISFEDEIKLAQTKEYANYYEEALNSLIQEKEVSELEAEINAMQNDLKNEIALSVIENREVNNDLVNAKKSELNVLYEQLSIAKSELRELQKNADIKLPSERNTSLQMQNMASRGVKPIDVEELALAELNLPKSGIIIDTTSSKAISALKNLPLDLKTPSGLVYRVQVGAFSKPIPSDLFKEFAPVTTEKIPNSNITRYLAGYFNSSEKATEARDQIRGLGYADAFIIAYCDGVRISIAEAKILEESGECIPKKEDELVMEVATNVIQQLGLDTAALIVDVDKYDYNKAIGAAQAEAAEKHLGLFYTVQVGVFLHPVNATTVKEMSPLMTERLTNGTIRYSVGMFHSAQEATPTKQLAIEKGVSDAFITAYYKGKRISVNEAQKLLELNGSKILEPLETFNTELKVDIVKVDTSKVIANVVEYNDEIEVATIKSNPKIYQIVTKKKFNEFPRDVLNRYNMKGQFYFDEKDSIVKSNLINEQEDLPGIYYFKDDVDTLIFEDSSALILKHLKIKCNGKIPGDVMDWLNKINLRKEFYSKESLIEICIFDIDETKLKGYEDKLNQFGLSFEYIIPEQFK